MKKDTYYFSHDYNARQDEKIAYYLSKVGMSGYGIYWLLIERMHQSESGKLTLKYLNGIAYADNIDITLLNTCYNIAIECELFVTDDKYFWSERVLKNKLELDEKRVKKSNAGKAGMQKRWAKDNSVITNDNRTITKHNKGKESKVNNNNNSNSNNFNFYDALIKANVSEQMARDYIAVRKAKHAPLTESALILIFNECKKHNFNFVSAIQICVERNWLTFKYDWYAKDLKPINQTIIY